MQKTPGATRSEPRNLYCTRTSSSNLSTVYQASGMSCWGVACLTRDRGLVFRASTSAKVSNLFIRSKQRDGVAARDFCGAAVHLFHFFSYPTHAGDLNLPV